MDIKIISKKTQSKSQQSPTQQTSPNKKPNLKYKAKLIWSEPILAELSFFLFIMQWPSSTNYIISFLLAFEVALLTALVSKYVKA